MTFNTTIYGGGDGGRGETQSKKNTLYWKNQLQSTTHSILKYSWIQFSCHEFYALCFVFFYNNLICIIFAWTLTLTECARTDNKLNCTLFFSWLSKLGIYHSINSIQSVAYIHIHTFAKQWQYYTSLWWAFVLNEIFIQQYLG